MRDRFAAHVAGHDAVDFDVATGKVEYKAHGRPAWRARGAPREAQHRASCFRVVVARARDLDRKRAARRDRARGRSRRRVRVSHRCAARRGRRRSVRARRARGGALRGARRVVHAHRQRARVLGALRRGGFASACAKLAPTGARNADLAVRIGAPCAAVVPTRRRRGALLDHRAAAGHRTGELATADAIRTLHCDCTRLHRRRSRMRSRVSVARAARRPTVRALPSPRRPSRREARRLRWRPRARAFRLVRRHRGRDESGDRARALCERCAS